MNDSFATATCRACGEQVMRLMAALHVEDHIQRGEFPEITDAPAQPEG